jgi:hypothetical protein
VGDEKDVAVLDFQALFDNTPRLFNDPTVDPIHFNKKGNDLIAVTAMKFLSPKMSREQSASADR